MIALIDSNETSSTYEFTHEDCVRLVTFKQNEEAEEALDFDKMAEAEHAQWLSWLGVITP
jgi:hypothetical protein